ncbi:MAG: hypothetical protein CUN57_01305, partial [Phototrophicales bacterium]
MSNRGVGEVLVNGFQDSVIFGMLGMVVEEYPKEYGFAGVEPFWVAVTMPIPRALWAQKPYPEYIVDRFQEMTGTLGQAVPHVGEYYISFGWFGVFIGCFLLGLVYRCVWRWYLVNRGSVVGEIFYSVTIVMLFPIVSRGYLAQTVTTLVFEWFPALCLAVA